MAQLTASEAIEYYERQAWKGLSDPERLKLQLEQDRLLMPFDVLLQTAKNVFGREVFAHEFSSEGRAALYRELAGLQQPVGM